MQAATAMEPILIVIGIYIGMVMLSYLIFPLFSHFILSFIEKRR